MIEVFRVPVSKMQLRAIPADERNLLLLASHAVNQISIIRRLFIFSLNYQPDGEIERALSSGQSQTIMRFLFGALAEAWKMVKRPINQRLIGKDYIHHIAPEGQAAYAELKEHFEKSKLLPRLRNSVAYHHPSAPELEAAFEEVPEDEDWAWYPSASINNSFYLASDLVISAGILRVTGETDTYKAFIKIMDEVSNVSNVITDFLLFLTRAIIARHMGENVLNPRVGTGTKIAGAPNLYKFAIPFFTVRDDYK